MRLIDADALNEHKLSITPLRYHVGWNNAIDAVIKNAPTIDAVPVVRCKDCKWGKAWKNAFGIEGFKCDLLCVDLSPEAFCSHGERRSND